MLLSTVLDLHDNARWPEGVACSLGDALLCERSVLHRSVRGRLLAQGYRISAAHTETKGLYDCMPLLALEALLAERVIPVKDNVSALRQIVSKQPKAALPLPLLVHELGKNYLLHESCHCLAHDALFGDENLRDWAREDATELVLRLLLAEAFAVGTELIAAALADPPVALFGALSSYARYSDARRALVETCVAHLGWVGTVEAAVYTSLLSQLMWPGEAPTGVAEVALQRCGIPEASAAYSQAFLPLLQHQNTLSPGFRTVTAPAFFAFLGVADDFAQPEFRHRVRLRLGECHAHAAVQGLCEWLGDALRQSAPVRPSCAQPSEQETVTEQRPDPVTSSL